MENYTETEQRFSPELVKKRILAAREELDALCADRSVRLLAVTKTVPAEVINYAVDELGIELIGENRVQELLEKYDKLHSPKGKRLEIHLIGSLQTNKVKYIADKVDMIESLDSMKLAAEIARQCKKLDRTMDVLIEVNIGREEQKGGILPEELSGFIDSLSQYDTLVLRGLMTIAPRSTEPAEYKKYFKSVRELFDKESKRLADTPLGAHFDTLSMGMSDSFHEAIECGSTEIRLGSSLFGKRQTPACGSSPQ